MSEAQNPPLDPNQLATHYVEIWKQATQVNQHFNDIEWRIRGLALTAATFIIGAAGVAAREGATLGGISLGTFLIVVGLIIWEAFHFVDEAWYHQLLRASAIHTGVIEEELKALGVGAAGLGQAISKGSPFQAPKWMAVLRRSNKPMHSTDKLRWFYRTGAVALVAVAVGLQIYASTTDAPEDSPPEVVVHLDHGPGR